MFLRLTLAAGILATSVSAGFRDARAAEKSLLQRVEAWKYPASTVDGLEMGPGKQFDAAGNRTNSATQSKATFVTPDSVEDVLAYYRELLEQEYGEKRPEKTIEGVDSAGRSVTFQQALGDRQVELHVIMVNDPKKSTTVVISRADDESETHVSWSQFQEYSASESDQPSEQTSSKGRALNLKSEGDAVRKGEVIAEVVGVEPEMIKVLENLHEAESMVRANEKRLEVAKECVAALESYLATTERIRDRSTHLNGAELAAADLDSSSPELRERRATLDYALAEYKRQKTLWDERLVARLTLVQAQRKYEFEKARYDQAVKSTQESNQDEPTNDLPASETWSWLIAQARVDSAVSELRIAQREVALVKSQLVKSQFDLRHSRTAASLFRHDKMKQQIKAPADGVITAVTEKPVLESGDTIYRIQPTGSPEQSEEMVVAWQP